MLNSRPCPGTNRTWNLDPIPHCRCCHRHEVSLSSELGRKVSAVNEAQLPAHTFPWLPA